MRKKVIFKGTLLPWLLLLPQLLITGVFFFWPAGQAIYGSFLREDAFGLSSQFVGFENFTDVFADPNYLAAAWKQVSYNFIFFMAGLQSIPKAVLEAAAIDGARPMRRFWTIIFPLLAPTSFFLLVVNIVYAFFDTFGIIHALTGGGPAQATTTLIYKVYVDGVQNLNFGSSAAQSVILMAIVILLTAVQFRFIERKVHY